MRRAALLFLFLTLCVTQASAADSLPDWAKQAAAATVASYPSKVTSVVLLSEEYVTVDAEGRRVMRERGAVKVLQSSGEKVSAVRFYNAKSGRIRDFQGWLVAPSGSVTPYAKNRIIDVAASRDNVYDEYRVKVLECGCSVPGSVFAWEVTEEEKSIFTQDRYSFQGRDPVLISRYTVTLPASWEAKGVAFNRDDLQPQVSGNTYTWELRNLPAIEKEDHSPTFAALAPRLAVSYYPPTDNRAGLVGLKDWSGVSAWLAPLVDPPAEVTEAIRAKASQLTANATGELDKIRAIAAFAQQTSYVDVSLNLTRGGGYTPRKADDTLARNYGDCKDKATLMRSLLKAVGVDAYLTTITSGDRTYVRPEWPSPSQFNHAIIAVKVSDSVKLPTVLDQTPLGRLLIFDPTDPITPVGDLPSEEQGSYALVIAGANGALMKMPALSPDARRIDSNVEGTVALDGTLEAKIERKYFGQSSFRIRAIEKMQGAAELRKAFEAGISSQLGATTLKTLSTDGPAGSDRLSMKAELSAERFGQAMQGRLFVVRPGLLTSGGEYSFRTRQRTAPIKLEADLRHDTITIQLPKGFKLDEIPRSGKLDGDYGTLDVNWTVKDDVVTMEQTLEIHETVAPAADYAKVREFFDRVNGAQGAPVVLVKQ
ncbi:MAG: DUF3857 domain-containing protein [Bryobacteraceae bacterium]